MVKVYYTKRMSSKAILDLFDVVNYELKGKVAIKVHSGEAGNQNYLKPIFYKDIINYLGGTVVECNTAYDGQRNTTEKHIKLLEDHGWNKYYEVDLLDASSPDLELDIPNGKVIKKNYLGKNISNYDSMLVLSHFKGHPMGGYGGALKQLSIGLASKKGKCNIHSAGKILNQEELWDNIAPQEKFLESMADAAYSVVNYFKGNIVYINIMANLSVDCDCCAKAENPCMKDIGILASTDPVAIDQACIDLIYNSDDPGKEHFIERVESRKGIHTIESACELKVGSREYELVELE